MTNRYTSRRLARLLAVGAAAITIAAIPAQKTIELWSLQSDRIFGDRSGATRLSRITAIVADRDRNLAITQPDSFRVLVMRQDGRLSKTLGKRGKGPGDFTAVAEMGRVGDTLFVFDEAPGKRRVHLYDGAYRFIATRDLAPIAVKGSAQPATIAGLLPGGYVIARGAPDSAGATPVIIASRTGANPKEIGRVRRSLSLVTVPGKSPVSVASPTLIDYDDYMLVRVAPGGGRIVFIDRTAPKKVGEARYRVTAMRPDGTRLWSSEFPYDAIPMMLAPVEKTIAELAKRNADLLGGEAAAAAAIRKAIGHVPAFHTPVTDALVGSDGTVWIAEWPSSRTTTWRVLDPTGAQLAILGVPSNLSIATAQRGWLWSAAASTGAWFVEQYKIIPR